MQELQAHGMFTSTLLLYHDVPSDLCSRCEERQLPILTATMILRTVAARARSRYCTGIVLKARSEDGYES
jgi:hypothetical protein